MIVTCEHYKSLEKKEAKLDALPSEEEIENILSIWVQDPDQPRLYGKLFKDVAKAIHKRIKEKK